MMLECVQWQTIDMLCHHVGRQAEHNSPARVDLQTCWVCCFAAFCRSALQNVQLAEVNPHDALRRSAR